MHRSGPAGNSDVEVSADNTVRVNGSLFSGPVNITIQVPMQTSVTVKTMSGKEILIENVSGKVTASLTTLMPDEAMSFSTFNGDVKVTLPAAIKANVKMKTHRGDMFTDFDIQLKPVAPVTTTTDKNGKRVRVRTDRSTSGAINGGGPEIQFTSYNGDILIHKK